MHATNEECDVVHSAVAGTKTSTSHPCATSDSCDHAVTPRSVSELQSQERRGKHRDTHHGTSMKIDFGKAKMNQTYEEAFQDLEWTNFMVSRYEHSDKPAHQRFLKYVKLRIQTGQNTPVKCKSIKKAEGLEAQKSSNTSVKMALPVGEDEESEWEQMSDRPVPKEVERRLNRMEEALAQVISHL